MCQTVNIFVAFVFTSGLFSSFIFPQISGVHRLSSFPLFSSFPVWFEHYIFSGVLLPSWRHPFILMEVFLQFLIPLQVSYRSPFSSMCSRMFSIYEHHFYYRCSIISFIPVFCLIHIIGILSFIFTPNIYKRFFITVIIIIITKCVTRICTNIFSWYLLKAQEDKTG